MRAHKANSDDVFNIYALIRDNFPESSISKRPINEFIDRIDSGRFKSFIIKERDKIIAHQGVAAADNTGLIYCGFVDPEFRGKGLMREIYDVLMPDVNNSPLIFLARYTALPSEYVEKLVSGSMKVASLPNGEVAYVKKIKDLPVYKRCFYIGNLEAQIWEAYRRIGIQIGFCEFKKESLEQYMLSNPASVNITEKSAGGTIAELLSKGYTFAGIFPSTKSGLVDIGFIR